jgi:hypothetical protein
MTKFEYITYILGVSAVTPAAQYNKIKEDIETIKGFSFFKDKCDKRKLAMLIELKTDFEKKYQATELNWDYAAQHKEVLHNLAKQSAVQLISQGKVDALTMRKMASLSKDDFAECVKLSTKMASYLNHETKEAEKTVKPQDVVPEEFMK